MRLLTSVFDVGFGLLTLLGLVCMSVSSFRLHFPGVFRFWFMFLTPGSVFCYDQMFCTCGILCLLLGVLGLDLWLTSVSCLFRMLFVGMGMVWGFSLFCVL